MGLIQVPENRRVFPRHSVLDNLRLGGYVRRRDREGTAARLEDVLERFPVLRDRSTQQAGTLSGGEQQMLALGMALMADPKVLLLDEPSLGLAPLIVDQVFEHIASLRSQGLAILLVEQLAQKALKMADRAYVLQVGRIVAEGPGETMASDKALLRAYLGGRESHLPPPGVDGTLTCGMVCPRRVTCSTPSVRDERRDRSQARRSGLLWL